MHPFPKAVGTVASGALCAAHTISADQSKGSTHMKKIIAVAAGAVVLTAGTIGGAAAGSLITSRQIEDGTIRLVDIRDSAQKALQGQDGTDGVDGVDGTDGVDGQDGTNGIDGKDGKNGKDAQALPYGIAQVKVQRGTGAAIPWATYSTTLGAPVGDTTGGTFRFTCNEAQAPCKVSLAGYATKDGATVYPRVDIQTQSLNGGSQTYCEYGDGPMSGALSSDSTAPTALTINIGGSDDCGLNGPSGALNEITVPAGYYDVTSTFQFVG